MVKFGGVGNVSVGVVLYNNPYDEILRCVQALERQAPGLIRELLILDQGALGVPTLPPTSFPVHSWQGPNRGFGAAHNILFKHTIGERYLCLNPDAVLHPDCLAHMVAVMHQDSDRSLVEAQQEPIPHPKTYDAQTGETPWCSGACLLIPQRIYAELEGFDERFFLYCEDVDLSWRARAAGYQCRIAPSAKVFHYAEDRSDRQSVLLKAMAVLEEKWRSHPDRVTVQPDFTHGAVYAEALW